MNIELCHRRLTIAWLPLIVVVVLSLVMLKLALWQLGRADEKKAFLSSVTNAQNQRAEALYAVPHDFSEWQYRKIEITGRYLAAKQLLLDNQFSGEEGDKRAGYDVLTPFVLKDGSAILVNRGWLPRKQSKSDLPQVDLVEDIKIIKGIVRVPTKGFSLGEINQETSGWPKLIQFIDLPQLSTILDLELQNVIVMLLPSEPAGYERYWQNKNDIKMGPAVHYGYAFQWFALTLTLITLSLLIVIKKSEKVSN